MDQLILNRLGARIRARRRELRLTQAELGSPEYTKSYISQVEKGLIWPSLPAMIHIAQKLQRPIDWFLSDHPGAATPIDQLAAELGVEPQRLRAALERVLFGGR